uniref:PEX-1N domain-containing protein n=1 Tax=Strongyloides venezuelensis TaxID=75913 RepID=A0A0K0F0L7_STRVS
MPNILAIISFHNQSNSNGILSLDRSNINNINGNFIGTYRIRNECRSLVLNVYSIDSSEKKYLLYGSNCYLNINSIIGNIYGFKDEEFIEMEFIGVNDLINAKNVALIPKTENDYKIIDETSSLIEEIFLDQINVLENNQELILWVQENLCVTMIVKNIEADCISKNNVYRLNNTTQVIVEVNKKNEENKRVENDNNNFCDNNLLKINQKTLKDKVYRILNVHDLSYSTILVSDESISYGLYIVCVDHLNGSFEGCLKNTPFVVPKGHCFIPKHFNTRAYSNIIINSVPFSRIKKISEITIFSNQNVDISSLKNKKKEIERKLNTLSEYSAIVINCDGIYLSDGHERIDISDEDPSNRICGYFFTDSFPRIRIEQTLDTLNKIEKSDSIMKYSNLGEVLDEVELFEYQKKVVEEILKYYQYINTPIGFSNIILLKGKDGSGKSTIVNQLSKQLFNKKYIFSLKIDCLDIRNQKPNKIIEEFQKKLSYLKTTYPSHLIVDNFDVVTFKVNNDEDRMRSREK